MQEKSKGVKRLLTAIENEIDESKIEIMAWLLHYDISQLKDDIEGIKYTELSNKED